ncbi:lipopolysaccharide biosynthesis protein [Sphingobacterium sp. HMA12]|uniref:lipopolysaccharide biosynthesis protein n=1 Tax=Sphingobacterium sp. HMA12 TaxID=2050894 RepID=UPI001315639B|nr:lipopolysaccharide biosynthesis protein [Sphingobacterium sp. HMA12]
MLFKNVFWSLFGQAIQMIISFVTNMILARMLSSYEFGQLGIIMFFITIANVFVDGGLGGALVRKQDSTSKDYATVFSLNLIISIILYVIIFLFSESIASAYNDIKISDLLKVSFLVILFNAVSLTQTTKLVVKMDFKTISICKIIAILISSLSAYILAYNGFGVWSLIMMQVIYAFINSLLLNLVNGFYFKIQLSRESIKELYGYGINLSLSSLLTTAFDNIYQLVIGRFFSINLTGLYYQGKKLQEVPINVLNISIQGPIFSFLSKKQDNIKEFLDFYSKISKVFMLVTGLLTLVIFIYADSIILIVYGKKWIEAAEFMKLLSLASFFFLLEMCNRVVFKVFNRTREILYLEIFKKFLQIGGILLGVYYAKIEFLLIAFVITSMVGYFVNLYFSMRIINKSAIPEGIYLLKVITVATIVGLISYSMLSYFNKDLFQNLVLILGTTIVYLGLCYFTGLYKGLNIDLKKIFK